MITNDDFIRTTELRHEKAVQEIFQRIYDKGDIYKSVYKGWYCTPCEAFWTERQLVDGKCPDCERPVEMMSEESFFFAMSKYQDRLLKHIEEHPEFIQPESRRNEMVNFIKGGLEDLCVPDYLPVGTPVPFQEGHIIYVWFDALTNYRPPSVSDRIRKSLNATGPVFTVGKDTWFHTVIWPIILMAADLPPPKQVRSWLVDAEGGKMSKSKGNVIDPRCL